MKNRFLLILLFLLTFSGISPAFSHSEKEENFIVDETAIAVHFERDMDLAIKSGKIPTGATLCDQAKATNGKKISRPTVKTNRTYPGYNKIKNSIGVLCSVFKCDKCDSWHRGSIATAWVASADGLIVTNMHVVSGAIDKTALGLWLPNGKTYPILEVVATDILQDLAILRVEAEDLTPLPMATTPPEVGSAISLISHPESRYYIQTRGDVARYFKTAYNSSILRENMRGMHSTPPTPSPTHPAQKEETDSPASPVLEKHAASNSEGRQIWMNITAEYARGSSGGPILDERGRVVGMVSSTQSIYTNGRFRTENAENNPPGAFQMCIRNCVPLVALQNVLQKNPEKK